jgi:hypothetical protein
MWVVLREALGRWWLFKEIEPGHRYQARYHSKRESREQGEASRYGRIFNLVGGPAIMSAGFVFLPTPGPSYIIIVIGAWMLSSELLILARFFDRRAVRLRRAGAWIRSRWSQWPAAVKVLVVSICAAALGYGAYFLLFSSLRPIHHLFVYRRS